MQNSQSEILLIGNLAELAGHQSPRRFRNSFAPLGLLCLAATAPERIYVFVGSDLARLREILPTLNKVRAAIIQVDCESERETLRKLVACLRQYLPEMRIGISNQTLPDCDFCDFRVNGTGKTTILRILRGEVPAETLSDSLDLQLDMPEIPVDPLIEENIEINPEKWLTGRTIEIFQPWQGLLERSEQQFSWPKIDWLGKFMAWLQRSGYDAVHFRPSGLRPAGLHELRSVMLNLNMNFAAGFNASSNLDFSRVGKPLHQIWLYHPETVISALCREKLSQINRADCQACLALDQHAEALSEEPAILSATERICIEDQSAWQLSCLKRLLARFWRRRFFSRLFAIRDAAELIMFMKTSYNLLDILLASERHR